MCHSFLLWARAQNANKQHFVAAFVCVCCIVSVYFLFGSVFHGTRHTNASEMLCVLCVSVFVVARIHMNTYIYYIGIHDWQYDASSGAHA